MRALALALMGLLAALAGCSTIYFPRCHSECSGGISRSFGGIGP